MARPRIKRKTKIEGNPESNVLSLNQERTLVKDDEGKVTRTVMNRDINYRPNAEKSRKCSIIINQMREVKARTTTRKVMGLISDGFGVTFGYQF